MSDLIDRQAAIDVIDKIFPVDPMRNDYTQGITCGAALATEYIKQLPSAEPAIVRCKDCKYYNPIGVCIEMSSAVCEDSFCCWAERRTDATLN